MSINTNNPEQTQPDEFSIGISDYDSDDTTANERATADTAVCPQVFEDLKTLFRDGLRRGEAPTIEQMVFDYPQWEADIRSVMPAIKLLESLRTDEDKATFNRSTIGDYRLIREIGQGGAATVFEGTHMTTGKAYAIKVFHSTGSLLATRHQTEAAISSKLDHPNIVPLLGIEEDDGVFFLVMKLIRGVSLNEAVSCDNPQLEIPFLSSLDAIAMIGADAASALSYAHEQGVLHRDIKPANLIVDFDGSAWLTDFGCAKHNHPSAPSTHSGYIVGTLKYMAPEHREGRPTPLSDVYSLGLTLREVLTCVEKTFASEDRYEDLKAILEKASSDDVRQRHATASELEQELFAFVCSGAGFIANASAPNRHWLLPASVALCIASFLAGMSTGRISQEPKIVEPNDVPLSKFVIGPDGQGKQVIRITSSSDDAEEYDKGKMYRSSSDLEMIWDEHDQVVGLRFDEVRVPANAVIRQAYIQFQCAESDMGETNLVIRGILNPNPPTFSSKPFDLSQRQLSEANVPWTPPPWKYGDAGKDQQTPDCTDILHELISQDSWMPGNAVAFSIVGTGCRCAVSADKSIAAAPALHIEFELPQKANGVE